MFVIAVLWILAAINATRESQVYNDYVKSISPANAQQLGLKPAPIRGFFSFFLKSWDVTCFFAPFLFFMWLMLLSPFRNLGDYIDTETGFDKCVETNRLYRVNYITKCAADRLSAVEKCRSAVKSRVKEAINACRENRAKDTNEKAPVVNQGNRR